MAYRIGIDVGGTFTDICVFDEEAGRLETHKTPTTPSEPGRGIRDGLAAAAAARGLGLRELLGATEMVVYGTTVSTNAVITGRVGRVGLLCTHGFRDVLAIREGAKEDAFDYKVDFPKPYVPRRLTLAVRERVSAEGDVLVPLDRDDVRRAADALRAEAVDAVAIAFLWSFMRPGHELEARALVEERWPGVRCVVSHEVNPVPREYRRTIATVVDASLQPVVRPHLESVEGVLRAEGLAGELLVVSSGGGAMSVAEIVERPIFTVGSGPTMAPVAGHDAARRAAEALAARDLLVVDMGGTSFDVSLVHGGRVRVSRESRIGADLLGISRVDVRSIGAGGGSIASVDEGGMLHVGPASAGAEPGPACYGRGGVDATVTDADVLLGYLPPEGLLGGRLALRVDAARAAVDAIAERLGTDTTAAAYAIHATVNQNMVNGIEAVTIREGVDPKDTTLVAGGGACGVHVAAIAEELGIGHVLVPAQAGTLSAWGALVSDIRHEFSAARFARSDAYDLPALRSLLDELEERARSFLRSTGRPEHTWELRPACEARYVAQIWELEVPLPALALDDAVLAGAVEAFHDAHERTYGFAEPGQVVELLQWRVEAAARIEPPHLAGLAAAAAGRAGARRAFLGDEWLDARVLPGDLARAEGEVAGPAIVEEVTTTVLVPPGWRLRVVGGAGYLLSRSVEGVDPDALELAAVRER